MEIPQPTYYMLALDENFLTFILMILFLIIFKKYINWTLILEQNKTKYTNFTDRMGPNYFLNSSN